MAQNVQMSSAHEHIWTRFALAHNCGFVVYSWNDLSFSPRGLHLALCFMCTFSAAEDCRGCCCEIKPVICFICNSWPPLVFLCYSGETVLFMGPEDGWFSVAVTAGVVLWLGGSAPNGYSLRLGFKNVAAVVEKWVIWKLCSGMEMLRLGDGYMTSERKVCSKQSPTEDA